jgi:hypothetical protein
MRRKIVAALFLAGTLLAWKIQPAIQKTRTEKVQNQSSQTATHDVVNRLTEDDCQTMLGMIDQMAGYQLQMSVTMTKLMQNAAHLQDEKDLAQLHPQLAEQGSLLDVMQIYMMQQNNVTQSLKGTLRSRCPAAANAPKP